jgi:hypothetical protein
MTLDKYRAWIKQEVHTGKLKQVESICFTRHADGNTTTTTSKKWQPDTRPTHKMVYGITLESFNREDGSYENEQGDRFYSSQVISFMRCTGLSDKNKVEIYEGDFIERYGDIEIVEPLKNGIYYCFYSYADFYDPEINTEVVGNIYQNPELLKGLNG